MVQEIERRFAGMTAANTLDASHAKLLVQYVTGVAEAIREKEESRRVPTVTGVHRTSPFKKRPGGGPRNLKYVTNCTPHAAKSLHTAEVEERIGACASLPWYWLRL
jgi:hypothetical protein